MNKIQSTTVIAVQKDGCTAMAADGQVTLGSSVIKHNARKVRRICEDSILVGFAGSAADSFALLERFEKHLGENQNDLLRSAVALAKDWRTDKVLRRLEAFVLAADKKRLLLLSGTGDIIEPDHGICAIGSGGSFAHAAACAYLEGSSFSAPEIAEKSLKIASEICIYTNASITVEELK